MAKVYYGSQVTDIIGSVGGLTFQKSNQSATVRQRPISSVALTEAQQTQNALFSSSVNAWQSLTVGEQSDWAVFAAANPKVDYFGRFRTISGYNWFVSLYITASVLGRTPHVTPPVYAAMVMPPVPTLLLKPSTPELQMTFSPPYAVSNRSLLVFASPMVLSPVYNNRNNLYFIYKHDVALIGSINLWSYYLSAFMASQAFTCSSNFAGGIKIGIVAVSQVTYISSPMTFAFSSYLP